uniref:TRAF3-interacting protein 1 N-terminal domain-containing protein n=1 Tax=Caenorhabditis japonica TaxID=281687 RepID=A0A8R1DTN5_CAEJA
MSIEETQKIFKDIIQKPNLTEQLLLKPPFKFIVDIVNNVIHSTGYLKNEFSDEELSKAGSDKQTKIAFLEKLIAILDDGSLENVKASKIITGKSPEETNKMLQKLGTNATNFLSGNQTSTKKIKKSKSSSEVNKDGKSKTKKSKKTDPEAQSSEKPEHSVDQKASETTEKNEKKKSSSKKRHTSSDRQSSKKSSKNSESAEVKKESTKKTKKDPSKRILKHADSMIAINGDDPQTPNNDMDAQLDEGYEETEISEPQEQNTVENEMQQLNSPSELQLPSIKVEDSDVDDGLRMVNIERQNVVRESPGTAHGRPMTSMKRPGTAASRAAPPKLKKKQIATIDVVNPNIQLKSEIISDTVDSTAEKDDHFIMENENEESTNFSTLTDETDRGALVQKIMEKKTEIEDVASQKQSEKTEAEKIDSVEKEKIKNLRDKLQDLTRSAYPLARLFDFANENIESMVKELERWRSEQRHKEQEDQNIKAAGFANSNRFFFIITNLQKEIELTKEELIKARGRVLNNESRIRQFISNI